MRHLAVMRSGVPIQQIPIRGDVLQCRRVYI
jgi:hypothetical protein